MPVGQRVVIAYPALAALEVMMVQVLAAALVQHQQQMLLLEQMAVVVVAVSPLETAQMVVARLLLI